MDTVEAPKYPLTISQDAIDCIIEMAGYGISYWAVSATQLTEARTYTVIDSDDQKEYVLSYEKIVESFWDLANFAKQIKGASLASYVRKYIIAAMADGLRNGGSDIEAGHIDAEAADMIIQYACFGEIVYG